MHLNIFGPWQLCLTTLTHKRCQAIAQNRRPRTERSRLLCIRIGIGRHSRIRANTLLSNAGAGVGHIASNTSGAKTFVGLTLCVTNSCRMITIILHH